VAENLASDPFAREPEDIVLGAAPLIRVIAQVRHPKLTALTGELGEKNALRFAQAVADTYPVFGETPETNYIITASGVESRPSTDRNWQLKSADDHWQVSFSQDFLAITTDSYTRREEFLARLDQVSAPYADIVQPPKAVRVGVRYTNRLDNKEHLARLPNLIRPEVLGPVSGGVQSKSHLLHAFTQTQYEIEDHFVTANWGLLPPKAVVDPTLGSSENQSWLLDIDAFSQTASEFSTRIIHEHIRELTVYAYRLFRWAVTDEFLQEFREKG
jgi:uncharacterized protein (TIGR04255 family)